MPVVETSKEQAADITVKYNDPPKPDKKWGSISDGTNRFSGPPELLSQFPIGGTYRLLWKPFGDNGKAIVKKLDNLNAAPKQNTRPSTSSRDSEQIFVTALLKAYIEAGMIPADTEAVVKAVAKLRAAYAMTFGGVQAQSRDDMDDAIGF